MSWNYRIRKQTIKGRTYYGLVEAFYNSRGQVCATTKDAILDAYDSPRELIEDLDLMLRDAKRARKNILDKNMKYAKSDWETK